MFCRFFINRPVLAIVLAFLLTLFGLISLRALPVEQYPNLSPPVVMVQAYYPGADALAISQRVAAVIEDAIDGCEGLSYMQSSSSSSGLMVLSIFFRLGTDKDKALADVNSRLSRVTSKLPASVTRLGLSSYVTGGSMLGVLAIFSPDESVDEITLSNWAEANVRSALLRVNGLASVQLISGKEYSMRIWPDNFKMAMHKLSSRDLLAAIKDSNQQSPVGSIANDELLYKLQSSKPLQSKEEFEQIIVKADGSNFLRLKDIARVELGAQNYDFAGRMNAKAAIPLMLTMQSGANAIDVLNAVRDSLSEIEFAPGIAYDLGYDTTAFVKESIKEVSKTFLEAILLVLLVMFVFLKSFKATLIPLLAVPISLLGSFIFLYLFGFSLNLLTLFALILAIGIVVDDAIIVVENTERILRLKPELSAKEAAIISMDEVARPVVSIVLVLCAVFIPASFMDGFLGQIQKQFALTLAISVCISGLVALTLTPALCAMFLDAKRKSSWKILSLFERGFNACTNRFGLICGFFIRHYLLSLLIFTLFSAAVTTLLLFVPRGFLPDEDEGAIIAINSLPAGASLERTRAFGDKLDAKLRERDDVETSFFMNGFDPSTQSLQSNSSLAFIILKKERKTDSRLLAQELFKDFYADKEALSFFFTPPAMSGASLTGGFDIYLQSKSFKNYAQMEQDLAPFLAKALKSEKLFQVRADFDLSFPEYEVKVDLIKAKAYGLALSSIYEALFSNFADSYADDFMIGGKSFPVNIRASEHFRLSQNNAHQIFVQNAKGQSFSLSSFIELKATSAPASLARFNKYPAIHITGMPRFWLGVSAKDALDEMKQISKEELDLNLYSLAFAGSSLELINSLGQSELSFIYALIFVFLILAAQYERWFLPLAVLAGLPFAVFGALLFTLARGLINDLYFQVGLILLIGLSAKNAILMVEFALKLRKEQGLELMQAAIEAAKLRLRPIIMTSLAFGFGILPLAISSGPGSASRHALSTGLIGGIIFSALIAVFFVPVFFYLLERIVHKGEKHAYKGAKHA